MPDWSYQTVFRPMLFQLGAAAGRDLALGFMGGLARLPGGRWVIRWMGHMQPDARLAVKRRGRTFPTAVGIGCAIDPQLAATPAFAEFGVGFLEVGPVVVQPDPNAGRMQLDAAAETLIFEFPRAALTPQAARERLVRDGPQAVPVLARVEPNSADDARWIVDHLVAVVDGFIVPVDQLDAMQAAWQSSAESREPASTGRLLFAAVDCRDWRDDAQRRRCAHAVEEGWLSGIVVMPAAGGGKPLVLGKTQCNEALETVRSIRAALGPEPIVIGAVGVHAPADALDYLDAGADLVQVDSGLVFGGPGLPKRINEALLYRRLTPDRGSVPAPRPAGAESWFWAMLMGAAMFGGGLLAMGIATTRVVLPYDEQMAGLTRPQLAQVNEHLLAFMTHDRVTLAGTMLTVGILYVTYAWWGIRRGVHWAYLSVVVSALAGFCSFFSFLGFGYFDPFHAFVTAVLFQLLLMTVHARLPKRERMEMPDLRNNVRWRASQWGQLLFVIHGAVLIVAGSVISLIGMTTVFVPEDLEFMQTTAAELSAAHPNLIPLVAHDRATFGGMLIACGVATLLPALWGFRRGQAWLWWGLMLAGSTAYLSTILVHWTVGYHSLKHLLPAYFGWLGLWAGGLASYGFLVARDPELEAEWSRRLGVH